MEFKADGKYTVITINWMAVTVKTEVTCVTGGDLTTATFKEKGKRKQIQFTGKPKSMLVFEGWNIIRVDSDTSRFSGNACFNLLGTTEEVRQLIETKNLNQEVEKSKILAIEQTTKTTTQGFEEITVKENLVYPEIDTDHAVIKQLKEKAQNE